MGDVSIILVSPQMGENIGASARAMKNFGLTDMRIVAPRDGWPNDKAEAMSVGAIDIIQNARIFPDIESSIADLEHIFAASAIPRDMNKEIILSKDISSSNIKAKKIGVMLGRESSGLTNEELSYANSIITIDTDPDFSSLNIAHAVSVIAYEFFQKQPRKDLANIQELASKEELNYFFEALIDKLDNKGFFKVPEKKPLMSQNIRNIFQRIDNLSKSEIQTLRGIIKNLTK